MLLFRKQFKLSYKLNGQVLAAVLVRRGRRGVKITLNKSKSKFSWSL